METDTTPLRRATPDDIAALAELWALAFPGKRTAADRAEALRDGGPWGGWEDCWLVESNGRVDGALRTLSLTVRVFGRPLPVLGVAGVAVAPHARRRGLGSAMTRAALRIGRDRGDLLSALYPFRVDFYARLGFGLAGELHRYRFPPEGLPLFPGMERVERISSSGEELPGIHEALGPLCHGHVVRSARRWEAVLQNAPIAFGIRRPAWGTGGGGGPAAWSGYLLGRVARLSGGRGHAFRIAELLVEDGDAYRAALGWLAAQRDAWREVTYDARPGERFEQVLANPRLPGTGSTRELWFQSATVLRGPMVRILDVPGVLGRLGASEGTGLALVDPELPENTGRWRVGAEPVLVERVSTSVEPGEPGVLNPALAASLLLEGRLPGAQLPVPGFDPPMGIGDFRLLDAF